MIKINLDQVTSININRKLQCKWYKYHEKSFWNNAGFRDQMGCFPSNMDVICKDEFLYIDSNVVYYLPHIEFRLSDGTIRTQYFNTSSALDLFLQSEQIMKINWLTLN